MPASPAARPLDVLFLRNIRGLEAPSGAEVYLAGLARALPREQVAPHILFVTDPARDHGRCLKLFDEAGVSYETCDVGSAGNFADFRRAKALIAGRRPDALHGMDHRSDVLAAILKRRTGIPTVATFQGW